MFRPANNNEGLTLVELLVAMAILFLVISAASSFLNLGNNSYRRGLGRFNLQSTLRLAGDFITNEIRYSIELNILESIEGSNINDALVDSVILQYKKFGDTDFRYLYINNNNQLKSIFNGETRTIGDPLLLAFHAEFNNNVNVDFRLTGLYASQELKLETTVLMLNKHR